MGNLDFGRWVYEMNRFEMRSRNIEDLIGTGNSRQTAGWPGLSLLQLSTCRTMTNERSRTNEDERIWLRWSVISWTSRRRTLCLSWIRAPCTPCFTSSGVEFHRVQFHRYLEFRWLIWKQSSIFYWISKLGLQGSSTIKIRNRDDRPYW